LTDLPMVIAFSAVAVVLLTLISYMLYRRALEMGHPAGRVGPRLVVFGLGCLGALSVGLYFHHLYPQGLFNVNFGGGSQPVALVGGPQAKGPLLVAILGMIVCALVAWLAMRPLQTPPPDAPEGKPE